IVRLIVCICFFFFFQAEDGIRDYKVTGVQTCALPIFDADGAEAVAVEELDGGGDEAFAAGLGRGREAEELRDRLRGRDGHVVSRSEERRVGKECRSRWSADH